jgi:hypothetical protein
VYRIKFLTQYASTGRRLLDFSDHRRLTGGYPVQQCGNEASDRFSLFNLQHQRIHTGQAKPRIDLFRLAREDAFENIRGIAH